MTLPTLRDYQVDVVNKCRAERAKGKRRIILQAETGAGKTHIAGSITHSAFGKGSRILFLASGRELVDQASTTFWDWNVPHGIIMAGVEHIPASVQIASKETFESWYMKRRIAPLPDFDLVFSDECHLSMSDGWLSILRGYYQKGATLLGLTATPSRQDGRGLGDFWDAMVQSAKPSQLIKEGWVVPTQVFRPFVPNLKGVKRSGGDYSLPDLGKRMDKPTLVGSVVANWKTYGEDRQTIVTATTISHALHLRDEFRRAGINCEHIDGETPVTERTTILGGFKDSKIKVLTNVGVLKQGVDIPAASCLVLVRPTLSYVFFRQSIGRVKRPYAGKESCILLDHAGAILRHGHPDDDVDWHLDVSCNHNTEIAKKVKKEKKVLTCPACYCCWNGSNICPNCGHILKKQPKEKEFKKGMLVKHETTYLMDELKDEDMERYWHRCLGVQANRGTTVSAAAAMFYSKYRRWPNPKWRNYIDRSLWRSTKVYDAFPQFCRQRA